eukprot:3792465-Amphidinium_carterae.1
MKKQLGVLLCDGLLEVTSMTPNEGSVLGGASLIFEGRGFLIYSALNNVTLLGQSTGAQGECEVLQVIASLSRGRKVSMTKLTCRVPDMNLLTDYWASTDTEEDFAIT